MRVTHAKHFMPGFGTAVAIFTVYLLAERAYMNLGGSTPAHKPEKKLKAVEDSRF